MATPVELPRVLTKGGCSFDLPDMSFTSTNVLVRAINSEDVHQVRFLLKKGCHPNKAVGEKSIRPLMVACHIRNNAKRLAIFKSLFHHNVDPELTDAFGQNSLMYACAMNRIKELQCILDNYVCSFYNTDIHGNMLLHVCAMYSSVDIMEVVLRKMTQYSMNINIRNKSRHTPLDEAILHKNFPCVEKFYEVRGQSTLPEDKKRVFFSSYAKNEMPTSNKRSKSLPVPLNARLEAHKITTLERVKTQLQLPKVSTTKNVLLSNSKNQISNHSGTSKISLKSGQPYQKNSEEILYKLVDLQSGRTSALYVRPAMQRVPLDKKWMSTTHAHLKAITDMQEWTKNNVRQKAITGSMTVQKAATMKSLWKKVLLAAAFASNKPKAKRRQSYTR